MAEHIEQHCVKVGTEVLELPGPLTCSLRPLAPGLNFLSDAYFATLEGPSGTNRLFVKVPPETDEMKVAFFGTITEVFVFEREYIVYTELARILKAFIIEEREDPVELLSMVSVCHQLAGEFRLSRAMEEPLVLEDLTGRGYRMWPDEVGGLDLTHTLAIVETLARYHAVGAAYIDKNKHHFEDPQMQELFKVDVDKFFAEPLRAIIDNGSKQFIEYLEKSGKDDESMKKCKEIMENRAYLATFQPAFDEWQTYEIQSYIHGDSRANNYMFLYGSDNSTPVHVKMVDFQGSYRFLPWYDLVYLFMTSVSSKVLGPNLEIILSRYHSAFVGGLARLNYSKARPSFAELKRTLFATSVFGLPMAMMSLFIITSGPGWSEQEKDAKLEECFQVAKILKMI